MKRIISLLSVVVFSTSMALAQGQERSRGERPDPSEMTDKIMEKLTEELALSGDQPAAVREIIEDFHSKMPEVREEGREAMQALETSRDESLEKVLTPDQYTMYTKLMEEMKEQRQSRRGGQGGQRPPR